MPRKPSNRRQGRPYASPLATEPLRNSVSTWLAPATYQRLQAKALANKWSIAKYLRSIIIDHCRK